MKNEINQANLSCGRCIDFSRSKFAQKPILPIKLCEYGLGKLLSLDVFERLLQQTARIFPSVPYNPPWTTKVFNHFPGGQSTDVPETPRKPDIKQEATKEAGTRMQQPGRRRQKNPRRTGGYQSRTTSP